MATYLTPEEQGFANSFAARQRDFIEQGVKPGLALLAARKYDELDALLAGKAEQLFAQARADMENLVRIQVDVARQEFDAAQSHYRLLVALVGAVFAIAMLLGAALGYSTIRAVGGPLRRLNEVMGEIQRDNYNSRIKAERDDEIGHALRNVQAMQSKLGFDREVQRSRRKLAEEEKRDALQEMAETVERETNAAVGDVAAQTERMAGSAAQMSEGAATLGSNSSSVAAAAEQALANAETLAEAAAVMRSSIGDIAAQVQSSRNLTIEAVSASRTAQQTIAKLSETATRVGAVTSLISEIAGQTNLLALNATIEAARAGDVGRGFAVVASEVKSLAEQTAKATSEIAQQIGEIQAATQDSVGSIATIGRVIEGIETLSSTISSAMDRQDGVTSEIARTVEESARAAREVAAQIVNVSSEATEAGRRAREIRDGSADIAGKVSGLRSVLVEVVRTSTADVDRRVHERVEIDRAAALEFAGTSMRVRVRNISEGGALVDALLDGVDAGTTVTLLIDNLPARLSGVVARREDSGTLIKFRLTEAAEKVLQESILTRRAA